MTDLERTAEQLLDLYKFPQNMQSYSQIYIYGAGMVGRFVFRYLSSRGLENKIKCFLTTDYQEGEIQRVPVLKISKDVIDSGSIVLLAAKKQVRAEMRKICEQLIIKSFYEITVFDDRNYEYYSTLSKKAYPLELMLWFKTQTGKELNLSKPKTFNEKVQWLKLYDSTPLKTRLADKYLVREWISKKIGAKYLVPLLGVWDTFDQIDFDELPDKFVLKCNHGSGWNLIVENKCKIDKSAEKIKFDKWMKTNYAFISGLELHYKDIVPKIIAEKYLDSCDSLIDYRFYCLNGVPIQVWVDIYSGTPRHLRSIYDIEWKHIPMQCTWPDGGSHLQNKPINFSEMERIARILSNEFVLVRIDFYEVKGAVYVGELTFTPMSGTGKFEPDEWDEKLGEKLSLSGIMSHSFIE